MGKRSNVEELTHFSLFSGIGGIDLAAEWAGFKSVGQCEFAEYQYNVLEKNFPDVPKWRDVRDVTAKSIRERGVKEITVLSGGFPCQPHSLAGKRRASADERDLWGEFARIISETNPRWVLGENVYGLLSSENGRFFGRILRDMAQMGYDVGWSCYGANRVGAIHRRERVFLIAHSSGLRYMDNKFKEQSAQRRKQTLCKFATSSNDAANTNSEHGAWSGQKAVSRFKILQRELYPGSIKEWRERSTIYQPKLCRTPNGIPRQMDRLKCLGNAVVPQQIYPIFKAIADLENESNRYEI